VGLVADEVSLGHVFHTALLFSPVSIIPPLLLIHLCRLESGLVSGRSPLGHSLTPLQQ
jgi:hypothetical protein